MTKDGFSTLELLFVYIMALRYVGDRTTWKYKQNVYVSFEGPSSGLLTSRRSAFVRNVESVYIFQV
jgi:hypothetical protein